MALGLKDRVDFPIPVRVAVGLRKWRKKYSMDIAEADKY